MKQERWDTERDGPMTEAAVRHKLERLGYEVYRYVYEPGTYFPDHTHGVDKIDAILSGRFRVTCEGKSVILAAGDRVHIAAGAVHSAEVVGQQPVVSLDAIKSRGY